MKGLALSRPRRASLAKCAGHGGRVPLAEFDPLTLESRCAPGLYAAGEVLDVDGDCGGFNLHWAWSSGNPRRRVGRRAAAFRRKIERRYAWRSAFPTSLPLDYSEADFKKRRPNGCACRWRIFSAFRFTAVLSTRAKRTASALSVRRTPSSPFRRTGCSPAAPGKR